jgi:hypothetical protein
MRHLEAAEGVARQAHRQLSHAHERTPGAAPLEERALLVAVRPNDHLGVGIETTREGEDRSGTRRKSSFDSVPRSMLVTYPALPAV